MLIRGDTMKMTDREIALNELIAVFDGAFRTPTGGRACRECDGFVLVLEGAARYDFGETSFLAEPGCVVYLPFRSGYRVTVTKPTFRWVCVDFRFDAQGVQPGCFQRVGKGMENAFSKLLRLWRMGDFSDKLLCKAIFYEIYAALVRADATESLAAGQAQKLQEAVAYIHENYQDPALSVERLAELCGASAVHFRRIFARLYHTSPVKYITALRLSRARELLQSTDLPVGEIGTLCGYTSLYYFDRVFKKEFGMQPLQFRRESLL